MIRVNLDRVTYLGLQDGANEYLIWRAVQSGDQERFAASLTDSVAQFARRKKPPANATFPLEWIALFESIVANFAMHRGMTVPTLTKKQQPLLMLCDQN